MRTVKEVQLEYTQLCAEIGDLEVAKTQFLYETDKKLAPRHERIVQLQQELNQIKAVQDELAKTQTAAEVK